jgi:hypothetical protein
MKELTKTLPDLLEDGQLTQVSLALPASLTENRWKQIGLEIARVQSSTLWWIGDWWAFGEHKYGDRKAMVENEQWMGPSYETCNRAAWVCRVFKSIPRRILLSFRHHQEVASLPSEEAEKLLDWCEETVKSKQIPPTIRDLRQQVNRVKAYLVQGWTASQLERKAQVEKGFSALASNQPGPNGLPVDNALVTWAESHSLLVAIDRTSDWGNPFEIGADGTRKEVIEWYAEYFSHKRSLHKRLGELTGKVLLCWCHPELCHGDFLLSQLKSLRS